MIKALPSSQLSTRIFRWLLVGLLYLGINLPILYLLVDLGKMPVPVATLIAVVAGTVLSYLANNWFVFHHARPSWKRLRTYCASVLVGVGIWYAAVNILARLQLHYLFAAVLATACSVTINLLTNFLWVWRQSDHSPTTPAASPKEP